MISVRQLRRADQEQHPLRTARDQVRPAACGVWVDPDTGVCWLVAAGLAKGGHTDRDDFYERVKHADESGEIDRWLPTDDDRRQLKRETAARLMPDWELDIQHRVLIALWAVSEGGTTTFTVTLPHPTDPTRQFGECTLTVAQMREPDFEREDRRSPTGANSRNRIRTTRRTTRTDAISPTARSPALASAPCAVSTLCRTRITNPCRGARSARSATWRCLGSSASIKRMTAM